VQRDTVGCFPEIESPTDGIAARVTGQRTRVKVEAADSGRSKDLAINNMQRVDVEEKVHFVCVDLLGERWIFDALSDPPAIAEFLRRIPECDRTAILRFGRSQDSDDLMARLC
jgi:hypothetical protein